MVKSTQVRRPFVLWVLRIYTFNAIGVAFGLACFVAALWAISGSLAAGLLLPIAILSLAAEGNLWSIWVLSPIYLMPIVLTAREYGTGFWLPRLILLRGR